MKSQIKELFVFLAVFVGIFQFRALVKCGCKSCPFVRGAFFAISIFAIYFSTSAQEVGFFRIYGPAATKILTFQSDGSIVWSNALAGTNYTIQSASSLSGQSNWSDYVQLFATNAISTNQLFDFNPSAGMAYIPAGLFTMGQTNEDVNTVPTTNVYVSAFYMDKNFVTYAQWQIVYNLATNSGYNFDYAGAGKAANHPVQTINWYDSVKWCNARSQQAGLTPVYYTDAELTQVYKGGDTDAVYPNWAANGFRLPTEAEWEKAARGGLTGHRFPWGDTISESQANYYGNTSFWWDSGPDGYNAAFTNGAMPYTSPAGYFPPNGYGLYDMMGNVETRCWDWYGTPYGQPTPSNPTGPTTGSERVLRGGYWSVQASRGACGTRDHAPPFSVVSAEVGLRCVRAH